MNQLISRQETVKIDPRKKTLHEWMCFEAESVVRNNWTDIAIHDAKILKKMRPGQVRLWGIHELGSVFLPMYCTLKEKKTQEQEEYTLSSVEVFMMRFFKEDDNAFQSNFLRDTKFYLVAKGSSEYDYYACPIALTDVVDLVFEGKANSFLNQ